jgi:hypothetical protein
MQRKKEGNESFKPSRWQRLTGWLRTRGTRKELPKANESSQGNEFKSGKGKDKCMVEAIPDKEAKLQRLKELEEKIKLFKSKDIKGKKVLEDLLKSMESEANAIKHDIYGFSREEIIQRLKAWPKNISDEAVELLNIPEKMYLCSCTATEFSEVDGKSNSSNIAYAMKLGNPEMLKDIKTYSLGFISDGSSTYFFLIDPKRDFFLYEFVSSMFNEESASWFHVENALGLQKSV